MPVSKLTPTELGVIPLTVDILKKFVGSASATTNQEICELIYKSSFISISEPRLRHIIRHIRVNNLCPFLASSSKGYYIENDRVKMREYIVSLEQRAEAIKATALALRNQLTNNGE